MIDRFWREFAALPGCPVRLLECGSRRQQGQPPGAGASAHAWREHVELVGLDCQSGEGVDFVADLHDLRGLALAGGNFDAVLICSTLEHVRRPWVVAEQLARVTRPGGVLYCQTHFAFPHHPQYGGDYFRFSAEALAETFSPDLGWQEMASGHEFPCRVIPLTNCFTHARDWNFAGDSWLNSWILVRRV